MWQSFVATVRATAVKAESRAAAKDAMILIIEKTTVATNLKTCKPL